MITKQNEDRLALMTIGDVRIAMPQKEIAGVEVRADVEPNDTGYNNIAGKLYRNDGIWPVICLNESLVPQNDLGEDVRFLACIKKDGLFYALACDSMELIEWDDDIIRQPLPPSMWSDSTALRELLTIEDDLVLYINTDSMNNYLNSLGVLDVEK